MLGLGLELVLGIRIGVWVRNKVGAGVRVQCKVVQSPYIVFCITILLGVLLKQSSM